MTEFRYFSLKNGHYAVGVGVVIDVLRAFTTAAYSFAQGAEKIYPVADVSEALNHHQRRHGALIMGEVEGNRPPGFNFGNSPAMISKIDLTGRTLIQRTSAGTQGIAKAVNAQHLVAASFVVARATAQYLKILNPVTVSFIITGESMGRDGDEDRACGEYIEAMMLDTGANSEDFTHRVSSSSVGRFFYEGKNNYLLQEDFDLSIKADLFEFCMPIHLEEGSQVMKHIVPDWQP